ncbi:MAG: hypothetical protein JXJ22_08615 [Bacteroidales bacterium]|nr:hypothetical protein [Bacteroidales bacterium]
MMNIFFGIFVLLHGLVHLLYFGQSRRLFELQPGLKWPEDSWVFSKFPGNNTSRLLAGICFLIVAAGFVTGGIGIMVSLSWIRPLIIGSAIFSSLLYILFWDGDTQKLADKGGVGILINIAILLAIYILGWPA